MVYNEIIEKMVEILETNEETFVRCVEELDSWNGFADGFRCFPMDQLDDLFYNCKVSEFLDQLDLSNFDLSDAYIVDTIYGLQSTNDVAEVYYDNLIVGDVIDELISTYGNIDLKMIDPELDELVGMIDSQDYED